MARKGTKKLYIFYGISVAVIAFLFLLATYFILGNYLHGDPTPIRPDLETYDIVFQNMNGEELSVRTYREGDVVEIPTNPTMEPDAQYTYIFHGWDREIEQVAKSDCVYTAVYDKKINSYRITFCDYDEHTVLYETIADYGTTAVYNHPIPRREPDVQYTYAFTRWDKDTSFVRGDMKVCAIYEATVRSYLVTFLNENGSIYEQARAKYGSDASDLVSTPSKAPTDIYTYTFAGWKGDLSFIKGDTSARATFTESYRYYDVTFMDVDGKILQTKSYRYGETITVPSIDVYKNGHGYFNGWDRPIETVKGETIYVATYSSIPTFFSLTVNYVFDDGEVAYPSYQEEFACGSSYQIVSPILPYYQANYTVVSGDLFADRIVTVIYEPKYTLSQDQDGYYEIDAPELLRILSKDPSLWDKNFILTKDISLKDVVWTGIGSRTTPFSGTFDGNGHVVSDVAYRGTSTDANFAAGFFNAVSGTVKNLTVYMTMDLSVTNNYFYGGGIVGELSGELIGCDVSLVMNLSSKRVVQVGGLVGRIVQKASITSCVGNVVMNINASYGSVGGYVGYASSVTITDTIIDATIDTELEKSSTYIGEKGNNVFPAEMIPPETITIPSDNIIIPSN